MVDKIKMVIEWFQANSDVIMNYAVSASAIVILVAKIISICKKTVNQIKNNELTADNDKQLKQFQAAMIKKQQEIMDKYMVAFNCKIEEQTALLQTRQAQIEAEREKKIAADTIKVNDEIAVLRKIKSDNGGEINEKSAV